MKIRMISAVAIAATAVLGLAMPAQAAQPESARMNQASYWESYGTSCVKVEFGNGVKTFALPTLVGNLEYTDLILKAGSGATANDVRSGYEVTAGESYGHQTGKNLSHAIYCVAEGYYYAS